jgi:4-hydroxy-tetrahydrodipicolinate reductase
MEAVEMEKIRVLVIGACGRMGLEVVRAVLKDEALQLVGAVDTVNVHSDIGVLAGQPTINVPVHLNLAEALAELRPQVAVDFTTPATIMANLEHVLKAGVHAVVGTTGLNAANLETIAALATQSGANVLVAPNFAIGAILMMRFSAFAAHFMPDVEIIELHHDQKLDAPSGTAIKTAELITSTRQDHHAAVVGTESIHGARGGEFNGIHIHSIRLPGLVAHQEVIFGSPGQTLTIRHDSINRESFMPGVIMAIKKIGNYAGLTYGLEKMLFED